jgi:hypothetical protein
MQLKFSENPRPGPLNFVTESCIPKKKYKKSYRPNPGPGPSKTDIVKRLVVSRLRMRTVNLDGRSYCLHKKQKGQGLCRPEICNPERLKKKEKASPAQSTGVRKKHLNLRFQNSNSKEITIPPRISSS